MLRSVIREKDDAIGDRERRIYDLKKKNQVRARGHRQLAGATDSVCWRLDAGCSVGSSTPSCNAFAP